MGQFEQYKFLLPLYINGLLSKITNLYHVYAFACKIEKEKMDFPRIESPPSPSLP